MTYEITYCSCDKNDYQLLIKKSDKHIKITYELDVEEEHVLLLINNMMDCSIKNITIDNILVIYKEVYRVIIKFKNNVKYDYGFVSSCQMDDIDNMIVYSKEKEAEQYLKLVKSLCLVMNKIFTL
jgi:hypothetical protein